MPGGELKQRKKTPKQSDEDGGQKPETAATKPASSWDFRGLMCLVSLAACGALSWVVLQQSQRFADMEEKFRALHGRTSSVFDMEEEVLKVSAKCDSVQLMLEGLGDQREALRPQLEALQQDVSQLKAWASGLSDKRAQLQTSVTSLRNAVGQIEERTSTIAKDFVNKVASVRTDVRRMDGLQSELESLLIQLGELEEKTSQVEHSMVKRIGDVLSSSIDRVQNLRAASERNTKAIEQLHRRIPELTAADKKISERLMELESGRAKVIRTVTFASDLKPKVALIQRDFRAFEPQVSDLTLRIGRLAEELMKREEEVAELRHTLANLTAVDGELSVTTKQVRQIADMSDIGEMQQPT